jgi:RNA polymerase sigma-70 factor, ECF subfamily
VATPHQTAGRAYDGLQEAELVRLAQDGHREAFRVITQRCNQRLFRVARAIIQNESEAEDIVQDAYLRAFSKLETFQGEASILTWMTRIAVNEALGRLRARRNMVHLDQIDAALTGAHVIPFPVTSDTECPEAHAARMQIRRLIEHAIDQLPLSFRIVFVMREIEGCSIQETAGFLDIPPDTVKTRLHRARRLLRGRLDAKIGDVAKGVFPFLGADCQHMTKSVLERLDWLACDVTPALR